ncbi:Uncharacterized protein BP5553_10086 [Venustampulla echinocandica]|uniref:Aminoglycoside phosphotransferase domain-containing protein n=1 Tax=Venustampulla echinocandica TaxID=2656787 RepID=A0A370TAD5_9HELO|nr:Uncharacterized protein BP5553_10086 [Venustampulla echinocandica]RDL30741.1 Uncharacterized protein BP5553_10086 [Venustampulla echinocandica]
MSKSLPLLRGSISLKSALENDDNILQELSYPDQRIDFFVYLFARRREIEATVSYHLGFGVDMCRMGGVDEWIAGSFNVCIPIYIDKRAKHHARRVLIRLPLPYKVGESKHPGNAEEKLRCEAAAFIWIQENCPTVPIPYLWGFGFPGGRSFTTPNKMPFHARLMWYVRRAVLSLFRYPRPCRYIGHTCPHALGVGYLIMDYIEESDGKMLSESWEQLRHDYDRRTNLFRSLSRIILSLAQLPLPRIGSLTIDDRGVLALSNRPLTLRLHHLENEGVKTNIDRDLTYSTTESYLLDLLACHDSRIRFQPNSIRDEYDGRAQMAVIAAMRAIYPHFTSRDVRHGPFIFNLTDLHQSNIFVDDDWNVKFLVDLEWSSSLPIEMLHPPYWLTSRGVDQLPKGEYLDAYSSVHEEFMTAFEEEEALLPPTNGGPLSHIMRRGWKIGNFWYFQALESPKGLCNMFLQHIQPKFEESHCDNPIFDDVVAPYWGVDAAEVISKKLKDKEVYDDQLRKAFENVVEEPKDSNSDEGG